ncbi:MAG: (2Fe-2S)-binding protein [Myxococcales bacterium]|nr:(2Fe-2S)-binding protein [Myxococcales bacterium]
MAQDLRVPGLVARGRPVEILVGDRALTAFEGETVAVALLAAGIRHFRTSPVLGEPRGPYCGMGICFDCVLTIDGIPGVRACQTKVRPGMRVEIQAAHGRWEVEQR